MSDSIEVSVALCTCNVASYLREQLDSILAQTRPVDEIVVGDDASTDETPEILLDYAARFPERFRLHLHAERLGTVDNFGFVLGECRGRVIFLSDQDDVWFPDKLARVVERLDGDPAAEVVVNDQILTDGDLNHDNITKLGNLARLGTGTEGLIEGCCTAFRRRWAELLFPIPAEAEEQLRRRLQSHDRWINELAILLGVRRVIETPLQYFRRYGSNTTDWMVSEPRKVGMGDLVANRVPTAPVEAWEQRVEVLDLYADWLSRHRQRLEAAGIGTVGRALAAISREKSSNEARIRLVRTALPARLPMIARLLAKGGYGYFYGWKSAVRDIVRSA